MQDKILEMFFQPERWKGALNKGYAKGIKPQYIRELTTPNGRKELLAQLVNGTYHISIPHTAKIPKDTPGEFRTVFVNKGKDRVFLSILNDLLFEIAGDMVHPQCQSYQKGVGCAKIVTKASQMIEELSGDNHDVIGWKADFSKYFDSVPLRYIDAAFDMVEERYGHSVVIDVVREYYHNDKYYDSEQKKECEKYQSLKQGCAVASWLADVVLHHFDEKLSNLKGYYVRYSDDTLYIGKDYNEAMKIMKETLEPMNMEINPKKVEYLTNQKWFKFLGFAIHGKDISLGGNRIKTFVKEITDRTIKIPVKQSTYKGAVKNVQRWLYYGTGDYSWATGVLKTINVQKDINTLNSFVMDCLRAVQAGVRVGMDDIGGLGWERLNGKSNGCIARGTGSKVKYLRNHTEQKLEGYHSLGCMRKTLFFGRDVYDSIVRNMI